MLSYLSKKQVYTAITLTVLVFLIHCGFSILLPEYLPLEMADIIAIAFESGVIGFQLIGIWYLISRLERVFMGEFLSIPCNWGDECPYMAVKRILYNYAYFITFTAAFISPFVIITFVNFYFGNVNLLSLLKWSLPGVLFDIFNNGVALANYFLLGTIFWILFSTVTAIKELKSARYGVYGSVDIYCPDRIGGLSPVKKHLMITLYVFLISITLLMMGSIDLLTSFINYGLAHGLFQFFFSVIAEFILLSLLSLLGVVLTIIGLNRLSSICLNKIDDRIKNINERYRMFLNELFSLSPDGLDHAERDINNLKLVVEAFSNERERLLQWHSHCSGVNFGTAIRIFVAYIPPLVTIMFQLSQLLPRLLAPNP